MPSIDDLPEELLQEIVLAAISDWSEELPWDESLLSLCRVSKRFHLVASPFLYAEFTADFSFSNSPFKAFRALQFLRTITLNSNKAEMVTRLRLQHESGFFKVARNMQPSLKDAETFKAASCLLVNLTTNLRTLVISGCLWVHLQETFTSIDLPRRLNNLKSLTLLFASCCDNCGADWIKFSSILELPYLENLTLRGSVKTRANTLFPRVASIQNKRLHLKRLDINIDNHPELITWLILSCDRLESLTFTESFLQYQVLAGLYCSDIHRKTLKHLCLESTPPQDSSLLCFTGFTVLERISIDWTSLSNNGCPHLGDSCSQQQCSCRAISATIPNCLLQLSIHQAYGHVVMLLEKHLLHAQSNPCKLQKLEVQVLTPLEEQFCGDGDYVDQREWILRTESTLTCLVASYYKVGIELILIWDAS